MSSPPNLRMMGKDNQACGNCRHYGFAGAYDPAKSREGRGRVLHCTKHGTATEKYEVCDDHVKRRS